MGCGSSKKATQAPQQSRPSSNKHVRHRSGSGSSSSSASTVSHEGNRHGSVDHKKEKEKNKEIEEKHTATNSFGLEDKPTGDQGSAGDTKNDKELIIAVDNATDDKKDKTTGDQGSAGDTKDDKELIVAVDNATDDKEDKTTGDQGSAGDTENDKELIIAVDNAADDKEDKTTGDQGSAGDTENDKELIVTVDNAADEKEDKSGSKESEEAIDKRDDNEKKITEPNILENDVKEAEDTGKMEDNDLVAVTGNERTTSEPQDEGGEPNTLTLEKETEENNKIEISEKEIEEPIEIREDKEASLFMDPSEEDIDDGYDDNYTPFDEEEDDNVVIDGYEQNELGLMLKTIDFRSEQLDEENDQRPSVEPGELYTDTDFPLEIAIVKDTKGVEWKRPGEFLSDPILFHDDTSRYDIGQGTAGTCWFLSTVATIADKEGMINQVIPNDTYSISNSEAYDGVFHARFFRFGKWEDIYIDDYIPVLYGNVPWGAKSSSHTNEVWVSLLEKAFARLHGSYDAVYGGQPGDAYLQLTGGIGERIELDDQENTQDSFHNRIKNALKSGSQITCVVPDQHDNYKGLVGGHAYSLVGASQVNNTKLVRVRNPWGRGEWKGAWSDESEEWELIANSNEKVPQKDDGEFYVCLEDFLTYFSQTTICSLTPDFDSDGIADPMNFILNIFGEWNEGRMGGFRDALKNPRFSFTLTEEGILEDGTVPFLLQMVQHTPKRKTGNASIRCNIYKIKGDKLKASGRMIAAEIQGKKNNVYTTELQSSFRHKLKPGRYMAIPSTLDGDNKKAFLLRIYTPAPLKNVKEVSVDANILSCENEESLTHDGKTFKLSFEKTMFGAFISGVNAGGQVSNRDSYSTNPQYLISIPDTGSGVPLVVHIMQRQAEPQYPVGFRIFKLDKGVHPPVSVDYLYDKYNDSPDDIEGNKSKFMISWDVDVRYLLPPGRYVGLVHMDQPDTEKSFAIIFKSDTDIGIKGLQTGE